MSEVQVSIGQIKRDISDLVNRVAYRKDRIILTSRGKPKAVLISLEDYERLKQKPAEDGKTDWEAWLADSQALSAQILERRQGEFPDVDAILAATRADLEARDDRAFGD
jgi:prevent-host-death family protein